MHTLAEDEQESLDEAMDLVDISAEADDEAEVSEDDAMTTELAALERELELEAAATSISSQHDPASSSSLPASQIPPEFSANAAVVPGATHANPNEVDASTPAIQQPAAHVRHRWRKILRRQAKTETLIASLTPAASKEAADASDSALHATMVPLAAVPETDAEAAVSTCVIDGSSVSDAGIESASLPGRPAATFASEASSGAIPGAAAAREAAATSSPAVADAVAVAAAGGHQLPVTRSDDNVTTGKIDAAKSIHSTEAAAEAATVTVVDAGAAAGTAGSSAEDATMSAGSPEDYASAEPGAAPVNAFHAIQEKAATKEQAFRRRFSFRNSLKEAAAVPALLSQVGPRCANELSKIH